MASDFSIKAGNFLYKKCFPLYNILYPAFKRKQDKFEIELLKQTLKRDDVVLDIGANIGFYARILSDLVGEKGRVHCFEPDATNFRHLQKAVKSYPNVIINQKAVGPRTEQIKIYTSKDLNVDHRTYKPESFDKEIDVQAVSIDDYVTAAGLTNIAFIKMDIQGFEMEAIKGMRQTLEKNKNIKMISEFWPHGLRRSGSSLSAFYRHLKDLGLQVQLLKSNSLEDLEEATVKQLEPLGKEHYFNIFVSRSHV